jgi:hypothetical protein
MDGRERKQAADVGVPGGDGVEAADEVGEWVSGGGDILLWTKMGYIMDSHAFRLSKITSEMG